jgi:hypothetical protein
MDAGATSRRGRRKLKVDASAAHLLGRQFCAIGEGMWKLFQVTIVCLVAASNFHWRWTPNPYIVAGVAGLLAYFATCLLSNALWWSAGLLRRRGRRQEAGQQRQPPIQPALRGRWSGEQADDHKTSKRFASSSARA